jgi:hypothetical protein
MLIKNMGRYGKGSGVLIVVGILGLVAALAVGVLIWRGILRW